MPRTLAEVTETLCSGRTYHITLLCGVASFLVLGTSAISLPLGGGRVLHALRASTHIKLLGNALQVLYPHTQGVWKA